MAMLSAMGMRIVMVMPMLKADRRMGMPQRIIPMDLGDALRLRDGELGLYIVLKDDGVGDSSRVEVAEFGTSNDEEPPILTSGLCVAVLSVAA